MPSQNEGPIIRPMRFAAQIADGQGGEACGSSAREREREREGQSTHTLHPGPGAYAVFAKGDGSLRREQMCVDGGIEDGELNNSLTRHAREAKKGLNQNCASVCVVVRV